MVYLKHAALLALAASIASAAPVARNTPNTDNDEALFRRAIDPSYFDRPGGRTVEATVSSRPGSSAGENSYDPSIGRVVSSKHKVSGTAAASGSATAAASGSATADGSRAYPSNAAYPKSSAGRGQREVLPLAPNPMYKGDGGNGVGGKAGVSPSDNGVLDSEADVSVGDEGVVVEADATNAGAVGSF